MKTLYTLTTLLLSAAIAIAQPNITAGNLPVLGDHVTIGVCSDPVVPATLNAETGENYTWDFSGLTETEEQYFDFVSVGSTPWASMFTNSTICGVSWEDSYSYYNFGPSAMTTEGNALVISPGDTFTVKYTDQEQIIPIPYTFGATFVDDFAGSGSGGGFDFTVTGSLDFEADGHGTLVLPNATYQNVVRYRFDRTQQTTIQGFPPSTQTKSQWAWVSADHRFWLLLMEQTIDGFGTSDIVWFDKAPQDVITGISETFSSVWNAYPNPIEANSSLNINSQDGIHAELKDVSGRVVQTFPSGLTRINFSNINSGIYMLNMIDESGVAVHTQKLIVK